MAHAHESTMSNGLPTLPSGTVRWARRPSLGMTWRACDRDARGTLDPMEQTYTTPLLDKLGIRPGAKVAVLGVDDPEFIAELSTRAIVSTAPVPDPGTDVIFLAADDVPSLRRLAELRPAIYPADAIWVVSRKGVAATLRDVEVIAAARDAGLVDNKVVSFSPTHTALRLVVPRAQR